MSVDSSNLPDISWESPLVPIILDILLFFEMPASRVLQISISLFCFFVFVITMIGMMIGMMSVEIKSVTFKKSPPAAFCCYECKRYGRDIRYGNTYPVVKAKDIKCQALEIYDYNSVNGEEHIHIKTDCGQISGWPMRYFRKSS